MQQTKHYCLGVCLVAVLMGSAAQADDVKVGQLWYQNVRVTGLRDGKLMYTVRASGRDIDLSSVNGLRLDTHPEFEKADEALAAGKHDQAIALLTKVAGDLSRRDNYLRPLVLSKLVAAYDGAGQFGQALEKYLEVVREDDAAFFLLAAPKNLPSESDARQSALRLINGAMDTVKPAARPVLEKLATALKVAPAPAAGKGQPTPQATRTTAEAAETNAQTEAVADAVEMTASNDDVARVQRDLSNGKFQDALHSINILKTRTNAPLAELFYAEGAAYAGLNKPLDAAIAYMRVAVHFKDHPLAASAMVQAAEMLIKAGKPEEAKGVLRAAAGRTEDPQLRQEIGRLMRSAGS